MVDLQTISLIVQIIGVSATATAAVVGVRSYINSNKRAEEAKKKEQQTQELAFKAQQQTLETRQAQLFMQVFDRFHETEFWKIYTQVMSREWKSYDDWLKDRYDPEVSSMRLSIGTYLEGIGTLVQRGLLSSDLVADILSGTVVMWWEKQGEFIKEFRVKSGYTTYGEKMEYLYGEMKKIRSAGFSPKYDPDQVTRGPLGDD